MEYVMKYNFDEAVERRGTGCLKYDFAKERGKKEDVLPLWVADMDFKTAPAVTERLQKVVEHGIYGYSDSKEDYFAAVSGWYHDHFDWDVKPEWLVKTPGVVFALAAAVRAYTEKGDTVLIQQPVYYPFRQVIESNDRKLVSSDLVLKDDHYEIDFEDFEAKIKEHQIHLFLLCSPHNPVGRVWTEDELRQLVDLCKKYNKWIISDEIHCDLTRKGMKHHPLLTVAPDYKDQIIACTAPSKTFNLAGMQISNIVIPNKEYKAKFDFLLDDCFGLMAAPLGISAMIAAYTHGEEWLDQVREYIDENIAYVHDFLQKNMPEVTMSDTQGTYLIWLDFRAYCNDEKKLEKLMHESAKVALDEGYIFGDEGKGFERINMASPRSMIVECMERIHKALKPEV